MFLSSIKETNRLIGKEMSNIYYWEKLTFSKLPFSKFKQLVTRSVFRELQLTQMSLNVKSSCCNLKIRGLGANVCVWLYYYFNFERNCNVLKPNPWILLNKNVNFNKNKTESKMRNPTHSFREMNLELLARMVSWSSRK